MPTSFLRLAALVLVTACASTPPPAPAPPAPAPVAPLQIGLANPAQAAAPPELQAQFQRPQAPSVAFSSPHAAVAQPVAEAFSLLAEIAVSRAKRQGLVLVQQRVRDATCDLTMVVTSAGVVSANRRLATGASVPLLPETCGLLRRVPLERLAADPSGVAAAMVKDLSDATWLVLGGRYGTELNAQSMGLAKVALQAAVQAAVRGGARRRPTFTLNDAWALGGLLIQNTGNFPDPVKFALQAGQKCLTRAANQKVCDAMELLREAMGNTQLSTDDLADALDLTQDAVALITATEKGLINQEAPSPVERMRAAIRLVVKASTRILLSDPACQAPANCDGAVVAIRLTGQLLEAVIDGNQSRIIGSGAELLATVITAADNTNLARVTAALSAVAAYAATFSGPTTAEQAAALRETRKQIIEDLIDASTIRATRAGDWVASLGAPVGLDVRLADSADHRTVDDVWRYPQVALPMGVALQCLPGGRTRPEQWGLGLHFMLTAIDLGQFLAYRPDGKTPAPEWGMVATPGVQAAFLFGTAANSFALGAQLKYARDTFEAPVGQPAGRSAQVTVFAGYYVSFFDLN